MIELNDELYYFPILETKTVEKKILCNTRGKEYPSITTVLSPRNKRV